jgi:hypothetical protein
MLQSDFQGSLKMKMLASVEEGVRRGVIHATIGSLLAMQALAKAACKVKEIEECFSRSFLFISV